MEKLNKVLFVPDSHHPYVDKKAWSLMLLAAKKFKPDTVVVQGDFADFYAVSSHSKDPRRTQSLQDEVDAVNVALDQLDGLKAKKKIFVSGNHEDRLERYLKDKAPELFGVFSVKTLFKLRERDWIYVPYKSDIRLGKLYVTHDCGNAGRFAISKALDTFQHNVTIGHTHRMSYQVEGNAKGEAHVGASFGWLGDTRLTDYMHKVKANRDWALGFGLGYLRSDGTMYLVPVPIVNYTCVIEGELVKL